MNSNFCCFKTGVFREADAENLKFGLSLMDSLVAYSRRGITQEGMDLLRDPPLLRRIVTS